MASIYLAKFFLQPAQSSSKAAGFKFNHVTEHLAPQTPPTLDATAAARWQRLLGAGLHSTPPDAPHSPWLHEEVARRMAQRLPWIKLQPAAWLHWEPLAGGLQADALLRSQYPKSECFWAVAGVESARTAINSIAKPWWHPKRWGQQLPKLWPLPAASAQHAETAATVAKATAPKPLQMLWANMALHVHPRPQQLIAQWHSALATDGFLMFSALGPDTCSELRALYHQQGWGPASHALTDMHDWGDMLVAAGFAEPVMDMERITLTFDSPQRALQELRSLGRNLHPARFAGLRAREWHAKLLQAMQNQLPREDHTASGRLQLTFEIIYGHAVKPAPRVKLSEASAISLQDMRAMLAQSKAAQQSQNKAQEN
jgi:malonyl-CoA O-methyltransferase